MITVPDSSLSHETISSKQNNNNFGIYSIVWLDASINSQNNIDTQKRIRSSIKYLEIYEKLDACKNYIYSVSSHHRVILIVSDYFGQQLIPEIHNLPQIFSIYILCKNEQCHHQWIQQYEKIKDVYHQFDDVMNRIRTDYSRRKQDKSDEPISISFSSLNKSSEKSTTEIDGQFVQSQLLVACLLKMKTTTTDKNEFISECRKVYKDNKAQLQYVNEFEKEYAPEYALWWYTRETFLYRLLNKALRVQNIDLLYLFGFYIRDLEQELKQHRYSSPIHVYRGQLMSIEELDLLKDSKDKLISVNSLLSTTFNRELALMYLDSSNNDNMLQKVLFEIDADPCQDGIKPFVDLSKISIFPEEEEILMMLGSVFRVIDISHDDSNIWHIQMNLCSENDCDLQKIFYHMNNQYGINNTRLTLFGSVLIDMANFDDAEKYLRRLLQQMSSQHKHLYKCYHALGKVLFEKGDYNSSLDHLRKSLEILEKSKSNNSHIAYIYNSIGEVYQKTGEIKLALESFEKALDIFKETFTDDHENIAWCYNNLGIIYLQQKNFSKALHYLMKALNIKQKILPDGHPCLGNTYNNLGNIHYYCHEYDQALEKYQLSYEIFKKSLTPRHPSIARVLKNIGAAYEAKKNFIEAKINYEKAYHIRKLKLSLSHPDFIEITNDIERVSFHVK
ncbi:unnamed protein product [Rotaria sp. Silwood1]|nr:unnamed protein product [Rotaria sp. Silwood1]CAF1252921.1 unnamed protein product [Rotaria sp. Silwood1]CAF3485328.1 unnamed protein product [Rotaria sp. Silwood1]CAF4656073.1 unnamed protein product [Rotaria sp. Silwood1]